MRRPHAVLSRFRREGWGNHPDGVTPPPGLELSQVVQLQLRIPVTLRFDVWIDDLAFVLDGPANY